MTGDPIQQYGEQDLPFQLGSGRKLSMKATKTDSNQTIMSVAAGLDAGLSYVFTPHGCFLTKDAMAPPVNREYMLRLGNHFYLKGTLLYPKESVDEVLAPVANADPPQIPQGAQGDGFDFGYNDLLDYDGPGRRPQRQQPQDQEEPHWEESEDPGNWSDKMTLEQLRDKRIL